MELKRHAAWSRRRVRHVGIAAPEREARDHRDGFAREERGAAEGGRVGRPNELARRARAFDVVPALARVYAERPFKSIDHLRGGDLGAGARRAQCEHGSAGCG